MPGIVGKALGVLISPILWIASSILWGILVSFPFLLLEGIFSLVKFIGFDLINYLIFGGSFSDGISFSKLPIAFLAMVILAVALFLIVFAFVLIKYAMNKRDKDNQSSLKVAIKNVLPAILFIVILPCLVLFINILSMLITDLLSKSFSASKEFSNLTPIQYLYYNINDQSPWVLQNFQSNSIFVWYAPMSIEQFSIFALSSNAMMIGIIIIKNTLIAIGMLIFIGTMMVDLMVKIVQQFMLFIISPIVAVMALNDNGRKMIQWKNEYVKKTISIILTLLSLQLFGFLLFSILDFLNKKLFNNDDILMVSGSIDAIKILVQIIAVIGCGLALKTFISMINKYVGENTIDTWNKLKNFTQKAVSAGASVATGASTFGASIAAQGLAGAIGGSIGQARLSHLKSKAGASFAKTNNATGSLVSSLNKHEAFKTNPNKLKDFTENIKNTNIDISKISSAKELETHLVSQSNLKKLELEEAKKKFQTDDQKLKQRVADLSAEIFATEKALNQLGGDNNASK